MAKSYYAILGITSMATADEVRAAYRRLVKTYHPDRYHGGSDTFRQIQEAYNVLGNAERRRHYERQIRKAPTIKSSQPYPGPEPLIPRPRSTQPEAIAPMRSSQPFGSTTDSLFDRIWSNYASLISPRYGRLRTLTMEVPLTRMQARLGGTITVSVPVSARCPSCRGHGHIGLYECRRCAGEGAISGEMPIAISLPPDMPDNYDVMIPLDRYGITSHQLSLVFRIVED